MAILYVIPANVQLLFTLAYYSVSLLSILGNFLIVFVVVENQNMHNVTSCFIANLAIVDIIIGALSTLFQVKNTKLFALEPIVFLNTPFSN